MSLKHRHIALRWSAVLVRSGSYKHLVPPGPKAMFDQHTYPTTRKGCRFGVSQKRAIIGALNPLDPIASELLMPGKARSLKSEPNVSVYILSAASIMLVIVAALLVVYQLKPPQPAAASAPLTEFSAERALKHLTVIAQN